MCYIRSWGRVWDSKMSTRAASRPLRALCAHCLQSIHSGKVQPPAFEGEAREEGTDPVAEERCGAHILPKIHRIFKKLKKQAWKLSTFNPIRTERFRLPWDWGGADCALWLFEASGDFNFCPNQWNMVSNDTLGLYLPAETLKPILCCILSPWGGAKVT